MMTVSVCVIAYNEEKYLPEVLEQLSLQTYPHNLIEIVLVNSKSEDNTIEIMKSFKADENSFAEIKIVENQKRIQSAGWNAGILASTSDVIIRLDAHAYVDADFILNSVKIIEDGEDIAGGRCPCIIKNPTKFQELLLRAENSLFGASVNKCRQGVSGKTYVKTLSHGAYRREVFEKAGIFNEKLSRTEDNELHYRMIKSGYKLCLHPDIVSYQYIRSDLKRSVKQKFGNGFWVGYTLRICPQCISYFHLIPAAFVLGIVFTTVLSILGIWQLSALMWLMYLCFALVNTVISSKANGFMILDVAMPLVFLAFHISYGIGTLSGIMKISKED